MSETPPVVVATVTFHSAPELPGYFEALAALQHRPLSVVIVDCASGDGSAALARRLGQTAGLPVEVIALPDNRGFAGGMNSALAATDAPFVLSLNADARPAPGYIGALLDRLLARPRAAAATGRLLRLPEPGAPLRLDACGMRLTASWRHLDRGSGEVDSGQYSAAERVFGATGAGSLFRREALDDGR
jgi:GT2 family glycosyltransferase